MRIDRPDGVFASVYRREPEPAGHCNQQPSPRPKFCGQFIRRSPTSWPLRGLFWLSKDLFDPGFQHVMEPEAQALYTIRNRLEHSYIKIHDLLMPSAGNRRDIWSDQLAYSVQRSDFQDKTLQVFTLARAALIYLSLGIHNEERRRRQHKADGPVTLMIST